MLSNCVISKTRAWYQKHVQLQRFAAFNVVLFWNFTSCQGSMRTFSKYYPKCKTVALRFRKTLQERRQPILKFSQDNPQNNFLNFLTSKYLFITLKYSGDMLGMNIFETNICGMPLDNLETLFRDYWNLPKDQHFLLNHTLLT